MGNRKNPITELAPCGVFCGACPSYGKSCLGCPSESPYQSRKSKWACKIRICCYEERTLDYCIDCVEYPCKVYRKKLLTAHRGNPSYRYRYEIPEIFPELNLMGHEAFLKFQQERFRCNHCGGKIRFYHYTCDSCGYKGKH